MIGENRDHFLELTLIKSRNQELGPQHELSCRRHDTPVRRPEGAIALGEDVGEPDLDITRIADDEFQLLAGSKAVTYLPRAWSSCWRRDIFPACA